MTSTVASSTMRIPGEPIETSEARVTPLYRTRKSFAVVHFEEAGKGRIVFLPEGAEIRVVGPSSLGKCYEVMFENQLYNIFKVDLLGPWSTPIEPAPVKPSRMRPIRALAAGACA
jgi:hypothetical protein